MKTQYKLYIMVVLASFSLISCDLDENPPFLSSDNIYNNVEGAETALNGAYSTLTDHFFYGADFHHLTNFTSGFFTSGKSTDRSNIVQLNPLSSQNYVNNVWAQTYKAISRTNDIISNVSETETNPDILNVLGQAYFLRAHSYFNLVRIYGGLPLRVATAEAETLHLERSSEEEVYTQIIEDATRALDLLYTKDMQRVGRPSNLAANMLLAKVYMTMAGNDNGSMYWQKAYNEAIQVYGQFALLPSFADLWDEPSVANNSVESIFEVQFNDEVPSKLGRLFTPSNAYAGNGWQRIRPNPETIDMHMTRYPGDPRIDLTFISNYVKYGTTSTIKTHPEVARSNFGKGFPFLYKYFIKDKSLLTDATNFNYIHFRYGDLLLMLAEIENELNGPANAYQYVNEVLARARNTKGTSQPSDWSGMTQDEFRAEIMREYQYELLGEGQDWFNNRRRGYDYFKANIIDVHNARNEKGFDVVLNDDPKTMLMPIPTDEINSNQKIEPTDQNPGY